MNTPAAVWAHAYNDMYLATLAFCEANGFELGNTLYDGFPVRDYCRRRAEAYAFELREVWLQANPTWLEQLPK